MTEPDKKGRDLISRGKYGSSPLGTSVFVLGRALDGFVLQRALLLLNPLPALFGRLGIDVPPPPSGGLALSISSHELTPFQAIIWGMSITNALKQILWLVYISKEEMPVGTAVAVAVFNTVCNSLNTLAFTAASVNRTWSETGLYISVPIFAAGILIESISEIQRKAFKDNPRNKGKVYSGGLFSYARHINYCGYMLWRGAMALAGGGWAWGAAVASLFWFDFNSRAIPTLDEYCGNRYGEQWQAVKRRVPYVFFPWVK